MRSNPRKVSNVNQGDFQEHIAWLQQSDIRSYLKTNLIPSPWFPAFRNTENESEHITWFSALVPISLIPKLVRRSHGWDLGLLEGHPSVWRHSERGKVSRRVYCPYGNEEGIEPMVLHRDFHRLRKSFLELSQEFRLFHNLFPDQKNRRFLIFNRDGDDSEAARYGENFLEIRTDLLLRFCATKQMALAVYVHSSRYSRNSLRELRLNEKRSAKQGKRFQFSFAIVHANASLRKDIKTESLILGKKYVLPDRRFTEEGKESPDLYQDFIIGSDAKGKLIRHTCDPNQLSNYFGKNTHAPNYLTPVFFKADVLAKYYADPQKYSVEDGYLRCGSLWGLQMDNDHPDYVVVWLGDLGRDLSESERNYWVNFNIPPLGRGISTTAFKRDFLAEFADPRRPDLAFKQEFSSFCHDFEEKHGWNLFLPLHPHDKHFFTTLHLPRKDNQAEFDTQLLALTKVMIDSLNEKEIEKGLPTLEKKDKGITKLEKFFVEKRMMAYEGHIKFLRVLQDLRSKSAAHRKGNSYDQLVDKLQLVDEGQQRVFASLLLAGINLLKFLRQHLLKEEAG